MNAQAHNIAICFTDGASRGNPGKGGWGAIVLFKGQVKEFGGRAEETTNNRMELQALLGALRNLKTMGASEAIIATDSVYVARGADSWLPAWKAKGWKTKLGEAVANSDQWQEIYDLLQEIRVKFVTVSGHVGTPGNERCDEIATSFADETPVALYDGEAQKYPIKISDQEGIPHILFDKAAQSRKKKSSKHSSAKAYSYVSCIDGKVKTHKTWAECEARVKGVKGTKFKKAVSAEDERRLIAEWSKK